MLGTITVQWKSLSDTNSVVTKTNWFDSLSLKEAKAKTDQ